MMNCSENPARNWPGGAITPQTPMKCRGYTACGGACFRGAGPVPWHRHRRAVVPSHGLVAGDERRRTSRGRHSAPRAPQESGATIPGTRRRPGQTDTRARGSTDHRPPTRHPPPTIGYQSPTPFSSFRVPQGGISDCRVGKGARRARSSFGFPLPPLKFRTAGFPQYGFKWTVNGDLRRHPEA